MNYKWYTSNDYDLIVFSLNVLFLHVSGLNPF